MANAGGVATTEISTNVKRLGDPREAFKDFLHRFERRKTNVQETRRTAEAQRENLYNSIDSFANRLSTVASEDTHGKVVTNDSTRPDLYESLSITRKAFSESSKDAELPTSIQQVLQFIDDRTGYKNELYTFSVEKAQKVEGDEMTISLQTSENLFLYLRVPKQASTACQIEFTSHTKRTSFEQAQKIKSALAQEFAPDKVQNMTLDAASYVDKIVTATELKWQRTYRNEQDKIPPVLLVEADGKSRMISSAVIRDRMLGAGGRFGTPAELENYQIRLQSSNKAVDQMMAMIREAAEAPKPT